MARLIASSSPLYLIKIEVLKSEESLYFSCYYNKILGPNYVLFVKNKFQFPQNCSCHAQNSHTCLWGIVIHVSIVSIQKNGAISLKIWKQTVWTMGLSVKQNMQMKNEDLPNSKQFVNSLDLLAPYNLTEQRAARHYWWCPMTYQEMQYEVVKNTCRTVKIVPTSNFVFVFVTDKYFAVGKYVSVSLSIRPQVSSAMIFSVEDDVNGDFMSLEMDEGVVSTNVFLGTSS